MQHRNTKAGGTFTKHIATAAHNQVAAELTRVKFISVTSEGATDPSIIEQEIIFSLLSSGGVPYSPYLWD